MVNPRPEVYFSHRGSCSLEAARAALIGARQRRLCCNRRWTLSLAKARKLIEACTSGESGNERAVLGYSRGYSWISLNLSRRTQKSQKQTTKATIDNRRPQNKLPKLNCN